MADRAFAIAVRLGEAWRVHSTLATRAQADIRCRSLMSTMDDAFVARARDFAEHGLPRNHDVAAWWRKVVGRIPRHTIKQKMTFYPTSMIRKSP